MMNFIKTVSLTKDQKNTLLNLWNNEYPEQLNYNSFAEFENYLRPLINQTHLLLLNNKNQIQGWAFTFKRENEKWFSLILDSKIHRCGYGKLLLNKIKESEKAINGWVIDHNNDVKKNNKAYISPLNFYLQNNFTVDESTRLETEKISAIKIKWVQ